MTLSTVTALAKLFGQYLLQPIPFTLTFLLPLLFRLIARKYIWLSLPLATLAEVLLNWDSFCYYEARGLALLFKDVGDIMPGAAFNFRIQVDEGLA